VKKKKAILALMVLILVVPFISSPAEAAGPKSVSVSVPIQADLVGSSNSTKTIYLDLPSGVSASTIITSSLKYTGDNTKTSLAMENGKIKLVLSGKTAAKTLYGVTGWYNAFQNPYPSTPGNSIWLYSDGARWQINEYDVNKKQMKTYDKAATDGVPSSLPPKTKVSAAPSQSTDQLKWYNGASTEIIDSSNIIASTIKPVIDWYSSYITEEPKFVDGKIIVTHEVPSSNRISQSEDATHPLTGHAKGYNFYTSLKYHYTADAKVTTYSYGGRVDFDYTPSDDPTLTASVGVITPNPNPTKLVTGTDIPVQLDLQGLLGSYNNTTNIDEWIFYAKKTAVDSSLQTKKSSLRTLTNSTTFNFTIDDAEVLTDPFTQGYTLTVTVRFKTPVVLTNGTTITSISDTVTTSVGVYIIPQPATSPHPTSAPGATGKPPIAVIIAPNTVRAGDEANISGAGSRDPDGTITDYSWGTTGSQLGIGNEQTGKVLYDISQIGKSYPIDLTVVDNSGMTGSAGKTITVVAPAPNASVGVSGTLKENRKVTLTNTSNAPTHYPLIQNKTVLTITALSGGTSADIAYAGDLSNFTVKDVLFRKAGTYKVSISVTNTYGLTATNDQVLTIVTDDPPYAYFAMQNKAYRDPANGYKAVVSIDDMSFSKDKDTIAQRIWMYRYDSDNDGSFTDESWVTYNSDNESRLNLSLTAIGKYEIKLIIYEEFGQPTIDELVSQSDRRWTDGSAGQALIERTVEVDNRAPEVDWGN
jgi:hypothetical protein